jgi:arabinan endo-1,5-alpha-L-arabinosidase
MRHSAKDVRLHRKPIAPGWPGRRWRSSGIALLTGIASLGGCVAPAPQAGVAAGAVNPVLDANFPDPAVIRTDDGMFYAYATQGEADGAMQNIQIARSRDLVTWERVGDALPEKPGWASRTQDFWAPHVSQHAGRYYLYYSAKPDAALDDETRGLCLAVALADRPEGPFRDSGKPLQCGEGFVNIDPMAFDDPVSGKTYLYWGSGFGAIKVRELAPDRVSFAPGSTAIDLLPVIPDEDPGNYQRLVEGAWVTRHGDFYYLFYSGDNCCGPRAHYAVMVARSRAPTGPFETLAQSTGAPGSVILARDARWIAPGHNAVIADGKGGHWTLYHAVDAERPREAATDKINTRRVMLLGKVEWTGGWPTITPLPAR